MDDEARVVGAWRHEVIDLSRATGLDVGPEIWTSGSLNAFFDLGPDAWARTRAQLPASITDQPATARRPRPEVHLVRPWQPGDDADFSASIERATNRGRLLRPDDHPLPPAWRHLPIGYQGRAGSLVVSGSDRRSGAGAASGPDRGGCRSDR